MRRWGWTIALVAPLAPLLAIGCSRPSSSPAEPAPVAPAPAPSPVAAGVAPDAAVAPPAPLGGPFELFVRARAGNVTPYDAPNAWAYVPTRFDASKPLRLVVFFHGFHNCVRSFVSPKGEPCTPKGPKRTGYGIVAHVERAGLSAIAIVPQLVYEKTSSDPLRLREPGALRALLAEIVSEHLRPRIGARTIDDVDDVTFVAASGGHQALGPGLEAGRVPAVRRVVLMDAFHGSIAGLDAFLFEHEEQFAAGPLGRRLAVVYSNGTPVEAPTLNPTLDLAKRAADHFDARGMGDAVTHLKTAHAVTAADFVRPITFTRSERTHDQVMRHDLWAALSIAK